MSIGRKSRIGYILTKAAKVPRLKPEFLPFHVLPTHFFSSPSLFFFFLVAQLILIRKSLFQSISSFHSEEKCNALFDVLLLRKILSCQYYELCTFSQVSNNFQLSIAGRKVRSRESKPV